MDLISPICLYASKPCDQPRSFKDDGELHRLCEFHRAKANEAQRRWHARRQSSADAAPLRVKRARKASTNTFQNSPTSRKRSRAVQSVAAAETISMTQLLLLQTPLPSEAMVARESPLCDLLSDEELVFLDECFEHVDTSVMDHATGSTQLQKDWWLETTPILSTVIL